MSPISLLALAGALPLFASAQEQVTFSESADSIPAAGYEVSRYLGDGVYSTRFDGVTWNNTDWTLTSTTIQPQDYHAMTFAANGYFGSSMASTGPFVQAFNETNGWPLFNGRQTFGTVAGFYTRQNETEGTNFPWLYQYGWDSVIAGIPAWSPLILELSGGQALWANTSLEELSNVEITQDFRQGTANWAYTWIPEGEDVSLSVGFLVFADKLNVNNGYVRMTIMPSRDVNVSIVSVLDGTNALRSTFIESGEDQGMIYSAVSPNGVPDVEAWIYAALSSGSGQELPTPQRISNRPYIGDFESSIANGVNVSLSANQTYTIVKRVGIASTDAFDDPRQIARDAVSNYTCGAFDDVLQAHVQEWASVLPADSVSDFTLPWTGNLPEDALIIEKQIATIISTFYLLMNTVGINAVDQSAGRNLNSQGISVGGLVSDCYGGQRFWDQDVWMHPQLATSHPDSARQITNLRLAQYPQALRNVARRNASTSQNQTEFSENAALYPWTSGRDANCTATGPCFDYQYHLNGDIVRSFINEWAASGDRQQLQNEFFPVMQSVSASFSDLLVLNDTTNLYDIRNMTDPDEYANLINNGGFTMALIQNVLNDTNAFGQLFGQSRVELWDQQRDNVARPTVGNISLEYLGMNGSLVIKQADIVLNIYPIAETDEYSLDQQQADLEYYASKQSPDGPAMTWAIFSIAASAVSASGCSAYTYDETSWSPYIRGPWFTFSEQLVDDPSINGGTRPAYPFLTGHGGFLQVDTFGYLGLRRTADYVLRIEPSLPPQIEYLTYPTIYHQGWPIRAVSNTTHTTLTRSGEPLASANQDFASEPVEVVVGRLSRPDSIRSYSLQPNGTIVVSNRQTGSQETVDGNILQCRPANSPAEIVPGSFANGAIDGASATSWQPASLDPSSLTIDTSGVPFQQLTELRLEWGFQPPVNATVWVHNYSDPTTGRQIRIEDLEISIPVNFERLNEIRPVESNSTIVNLTEEAVWSGNWVTLIVEGSQYNDTEGSAGSTVSEIALVGVRST